MNDIINSAVNNAISRRSTTEEIDDLLDISQEELANISGGLSIAYPSHPRPSHPRPSHPIPIDIDDHIPFNPIHPVPYPKPIGRPIHEPLINGLVVAHPETH